MPTVVVCVPGFETVTVLPPLPPLVYAGRLHTRVAAVVQGRLHQYGVAGGAVPGGDDALAGVHRPAGVRRRCRTGCRVNCWLVWLLQVHWMIWALSAVERPETSTHSPRRVGDGVGGAGAGDRGERPVLVRAGVAGPLDQLGAGGGGGVRVVGAVAGAWFTTVVVNDAAAAAGGELVVRLTVPAARTTAASAASRRNGARGVRMGTLSHDGVTSGCPSDRWKSG